jgi:hypothetical protein
VATAALAAACSGDLHENLSSVESPTDEGGAAPIASAHFEPDIQNDIDAYGCSSVGCHGSGLGGFHLVSAAAGDDVGANFDAFKLRASAGELSKVLVKATGGEGHLGGTRFSKTDAVYARWLTWIDQGGPR